MQIGKLRKSFDVPKNFMMNLKINSQTILKVLFSIAKKSDRAVAIEEVRQNILPLLMRT